ncbi:hypothetical protein VB776_16175 [Arcicella sp. DC2W]|uniref:50S ribosomal protein L29 n=1 Tax=Arcicella gelida TaxID=2984195 RepID=A0ABU5S7L0_9BACT|nr:hypothetical protein [Arcicella sp. DC2W]MEA5404470.1 hypothetical protein [Arcicella sp. DC2W]
MDLTKYAELIQEMRAAQSLYFSVRSKFNLDNAKKLERLVDKETKHILSKQKSITNQLSFE